MPGSCPPLETPTCHPASVTSVDANNSDAVHAVNSDAAASLEITSAGCTHELSSTVDATAVSKQTAKLASVFSPLRSDGRTLSAVGASADQPKLRSSNASKTLPHVHRSLWFLDSCRFWDFWIGRIGVSARKCEFCQQAYAQ